MYNPQNSRRDLNLFDYAHENVLPQEIRVNYPKLEIFLKEYIKWIAHEYSATKNISYILEYRDFEENPYLSYLRKDIASEYPDTPLLHDRTFLRILPLLIASKGSSQGIEAYFKLLLKTSDVEIVYPKDNMLRVSDGLWDNVNSTWKNGQGLISDTRMVLQDSFYYQLYSYVIKSGLSTLSWGPIFEKVLHPAGWKYFGEVNIVTDAEFEYLTFTPTEVPGLLITDVPNILINFLGEDIIITVESSSRRMEIILRPESYAFVHTFEELNILAGSSTLTVSDLASYTFEELNSMNETELRRGSEITLS